MENKAIRGGTLQLLSRNVAYDISSIKFAPVVFSETIGFPRMIIKKDFHDN